MAGQHLNWSEDRVFYHDTDGEPRSLPTDWTSLAPPDPFLLVAGGRSLFRFADLLALTKLLEEAGKQLSGAIEAVGEGEVLRK